MRGKIIRGLAFVIILAVALVSVTVYNNRTKKASDGGEYTDPDVETVVISIDEYAGFNNLLIANGGFVTSSDSINAKNGIKIKYVVENDASVSSDKLISGEYQGACYTVNRTAYLQDKFDSAGMPIVMPFIMNYSNGGDGIIAVKGINSIEDLAGKVVAVPRYSEAQTVLEWLMMNSSLTDDQRKEIREKAVYCDTADEAADVFFKGEADAAATWEPHLTEALSATETGILFDTSTSTALVMSGIVFPKEFAETHEEFVTKMIDGALEAREDYLHDFHYLKEMPAFKLMSDSELYEMCSYASPATYADNMSILNDTAVTIYNDMAKIWIGLGEKADPEKGREILTDKYMSALKGKYSETDYTHFEFTESGRKTAEGTSNDKALLKMTLNIEFEPDSDKIKQSSYDDLQKFADAAKILNRAYIQIEGNVAKTDDPKGGVEFSYKRARSVEIYLHRMGIDYDRFIIVGRGDKNPVASNDTEEGRQKNRRTEVFFKTTGY